MGRSLPPPPPIPGGRCTYFVSFVQRWELPPSKGCRDLLHSLFLGGFLFFLLGGSPLGTSFLPLADIPQG
eukprot:c8740_g1_i1 orf=6-215(-)